MPSEKKAERTNDKDKKEKIAKKNLEIGKDHFGQTA